MIVRMARLRLLGPRARLAQTLSAVQDLGLVHVAAPAGAPGLRAADLGADGHRAEQELRALLVDLGVARGRLPSAGAAPGSAGPLDLAAWRTRAEALRREVEALDRRERALEDERSRLARYRELVEAFGPVAAPRSGTAAFYLVLPAASGGLVSDLRSSIDAAVDGGVEVIARTLASGELAVAVIVSEQRAARVEQLLATASLEDLGAPDEYGGGNLQQALPRMLARLEVLPRELEAVQDRRRALAGEAAWVAAASAAAEDELAALAAAALAAETDRAFVIEGWVPERAFGDVRDHLLRAVGPDLAVERVASEDWTDPVPVELQNPAIFRPFEAITRQLPLPAYGTLDPTPFVAVGFPMLFGMILGDVGYGAVLAALSAVARGRAAPGSLARSIAEIGLACASFSVIFGALYGELLGDLGARWLGMAPIALDREEAILPALVLAVGVGAVHVVLGLVLGVVTAARGEPRKAVGRGAAAVLVVLLAIGALGVAGFVPGAVWQPALVAALVAFPVLVAAEGVLGPIELFGTLSNVLSYARIMAVGTASVMMAVVANRMAGEVGSALVGALFALVFHVVNFALGVFGPTIHVLRLHYVEFFGKFYHPDGTAFRPLRRTDPLHLPPARG